MRKIWRDHSLSVVLCVIGLGFLAVALSFEPGTQVWDILLGFSQGTLTVTLFYGLAGCFRERNKPED